MSERINPKDNRTFKTGPGNWTGPLTWHSGILQSHQGYITVPIPAGGGIVNISLSYPAIKPAPTKPHAFGFAMNPTIHGAAWPTLDWIITDGVYTDFNNTNVTTNIEDWVGVIGIYLVPANWKIQNTVLNVSCYVPSGGSGEFALDDFSLIEPSKIQHLPIMGVG